MSDSGPIFIVLWMAGIAILVFVVIPKMDRQRIREHIDSHGGKIIDIESVWFRGSGRYGRTYDVTYMSRQGGRITATCMTSMVRGVQWVSDRPPGSD